MGQAKEPTGAGCVHRAFLLSPSLVSAWYYSRSGFAMQSWVSREVIDSGKDLCGSVESDAFVSAEQKLK